MIISGNSHPIVLAENSDQGGLLNYFQSISFGSCDGGATVADKQAANLGDGQGYGELRFV